MCHTFRTRDYHSPTTSSREIIIYGGYYVRVVHVPGAY